MTSIGCAKAPPEAGEDFSDAVRSLLRNLEGDEGTLAMLMRQLEEEVYLGMDVESGSANDRALTPDLLEPADVEGLDRPDRSLGKAIPVAVATVSPHHIDDHPKIQLLEDHTPVEPYSPEYYDRTFLDGQDCWADRSCEWLRTTNDLTKENILMTVDYAFDKDFRWVDLNTPDPTEEDPNPVNEGEPRWGYIARSWTTEEYPGRKDNATIHQSYTIEAWIPRGGTGFIRGKGDKNLDDGDWTTDSKGSGTLRMLCLWSETSFDGLSVTDDQVAATTRTGIDNNFNAADSWLDDH